ncbi:hypothetical protein R5R35_003915 [Gryllus longicercus]|uniref:CHHC U11-48K-type domain-containing protein n=1 Tax=Gryllus longicercus TaxID=2509291 RepID=A0AAN9VW04_9ORTH
MYSVCKDEEYIHCPYNTSHMILKSRMQYHLFKCRKIYRTANVEICPFNASHHVPAPEIKFHLTICESRYLADRTVYLPDDENPESRTWAPKITPYLPPNEENWDQDDTNTCALTGENKDILNYPIFRNLPGATKSERKRFRKSERERMKKVKSNGGQQCSPGSC